MSRRIIALAVGLLLVSSCIGASGAPAISRLRFTAQEVGTALLMYTTTITEIIKRYLPKDVMVDVLPYGSVVASCTLVNDGKAEVGWADVSARWAYEGVVLYDKPHTNLRAIAGGMQQANLQIFATQEFVNRTGIKSLDDIKARRIPVRIVTKTKGSLGQAGAPLQLEAHGMTYGDIRAWGGSITEISVSDIVSMMKDHRADLWFDNLAPGHPSATELTQTSNVVIIENSKSALEYLVKYGYTPVTVKAGTWRGQTKDITQPQGATLLVCHKDLPDEMVYTITKAICENAQEIRDSHAQLEVYDETIGWKAEKTLIPLHPGAERYYRECGWMK